MLGTERRLVRFCALDEIGERVAHRRKERRAVGGIRVRWEAGDAVQARLRDGIREDAAGRAVGIIGRRELILRTSSGARWRRRSVSALFA